MLLIDESEISAENSQITKYRMHIRLENKKLGEAYSTLKKLGKGSFNASTKLNPNTIKNILLPQLLYLIKIKSGRPLTPIQMLEYIL